MKKRYLLKLFTLTVAMLLTLLSYIILTNTDANAIISAVIE